MDLSGRGPAYRAAEARCPACAEPMHVEVTSTAEIDVCDACGGLWIDWFDGELQALAAEAEVLRTTRGTPLAPVSGQVPLSRLGARACPRCAGPLSAEHHRFADARPGELVDGVDLARCPECAGAFVPRGSAQLLLDRAQHGPPMSLWEALVHLVASLFARRSAPK